MPPVGRLCGEMGFRMWLILFVLLLPPAAGPMPAIGAEVSVTGHAQVDIQSKNGNSFSATATASFTEQAAACDENACKSASGKALEELDGLFSHSAKVKKTFKALPECECSDGSKSNWSAACDKLQGLARRLCYEGQR